MQHTLRISCDVLCTHRRQPTTRRVSLGGQQNLHHQQKIKRAQASIFRVTVHKTTTIPPEMLPTLSSAPKTRVRGAFLYYSLAQQLTAQRVRIGRCLEVGQCACVVSMRGTVNDRGVSDLSSQIICGNHRIANALDVDVIWATAV